MRISRACFLVLAVACGGGGGDGDDTGPIGSFDAPPVQAMFTISGTATSRNLGGSSPEAGVLVAAYAKTDENTPIAMGTTDASGVFMLTITSNGTALDGFLKATKSGFTTSYLYPPRPVTADLAMVPMNMLTTGNFDTLYTLAAVSKTPNTGVIGLVVLSGPDFSSTPVEGAKITTDPSSPAYRYNSPQGLPTSQGTMTVADGLAYAFNAPAGAISVSATKSGSTFKPTTLSVRADALTQTIVAP